MKESIIDKEMLTVMFGFLFIGGVAAILGIIRAVKNTERSLRDVTEVTDEDILVYGTHV